MAVPALPDKILFDHKVPLAADTSVKSNWLVNTSTKNAPPHVAFLLAYYVVPVPVPVPALAFTNKALHALAPEMPLCWN